MRYFILFCLWFLSFSIFADHKGLAVLDYSERTFPCESYAEAESLVQQEQVKLEDHYNYALCQCHRGEIIQGIENMRALAEWGYVNAQHFLGHMYLRGREVKKDDKRAFFWLQMAANQDHALSQYALGQMYRKGKGVDQDDGLATVWANKAAEQIPALGMPISGLEEVYNGLQAAEKQVSSWTKEIREGSQPFVERVQELSKKVEDAVADSILSDLLSDDDEKNAKNVESP